MAESSNNEDFPTRSIPGGGESSQSSDFPSNLCELSNGPAYNLRKMAMIRENDVSILTPLAHISAKIVMCNTPVK